MGYFSNSKETKEMYREILDRDCWHGSKRMVDFCVNEMSSLVMFDNGLFIVLEKPRIQTHFCFGYSLSKYDDSSYNNANNMAYHASKSEEYFMKENLKGLIEKKKELEERKYKLSLITHYSGQPDSSPYKGIKRYYKYETIKENEYELTDNDVDLLIAAYNNEIVKFTKRLNTYLKRYGLTKINTWSYWQDA